MRPLTRGVALITVLDNLATGSAGYVIKRDISHVFLPGQALRSVQSVKVICFVMEFWIVFVSFLESTIIKCKGTGLSMCFLLYFSLGDCGL